jgi:hypothetical protein
VQRVIVHDISAEEAQSLQDHHIRNGALLAWSIYDHPLDYPNSFVCRPFATKGGAVPLDVVLRANTLAQIRAMLPYGLACFSRSPSDPAFLVETWI